jgi:hypothetical protein
MPAWNIAPRAASYSASNVASLDSQRRKVRSFTPDCAAANSIVDAKSRATMARSRTAAGFAETATVGPPD